MTTLDANAALVIVDMQLGFDEPWWGTTTNHPGCEENVDRLIAHWQQSARPVVVVRHDSIHPDSPLRAGSAGNALKPSVAAVAPSLFVTKDVNSCFYGQPDLHAWLQEQGIGQLVLCGIQTNMCVETTARMGGNLGYRVVVALDATRTFELSGPDGTSIDAEDLMRATATNLHGGGFATVVSTGDLVSS